MEIKYILNISIPLVLLIANFIDAIDVDQVIKPLAKASVDINSMTGNVHTAVQSAGGAAIDSNLLNLGVGNAGIVDGIATIDAKNLKGNIQTTNNIDVGGGMNIRGVADVVGGLGSKGNLNSNIDIQNLKSDINLVQNSGIGGIITGNNGSINGGAGSSLNLSGVTDLKKGISNLEFTSNTGTDGQIHLPGKLGGLVYHIDDVSEISSSIDFSDLSQRSLQILKETNIVANIDLPGDKLEDINIEANPSINISNPIINLDKLGSLKLLSFAEKFAKDMLAITEFNMLTETNILNALSSGLEFAARLDILRALAKDIGTIKGMPKLVEKVRLVLADMVSILEALRRVKLLPDNVRGIGVALNNFDLSELNVELPQLEALSAAAEKPGMEGFGVSEQEGQATSPTDPIVEAGSLLSNFNMEEFLSLAQFGERVSNTALSAVSGLSNPTLVEKALAAGSINNIAGIATMIPTVAGGVSRVTGINGQAVGNDAINALNQVVSGTGVGDITNQLLDSTPNDILNNAANAANQIANGNINQVIDTDVGNAVNDVLSNNQMVEDILNAANVNGIDLNGVVNGQSASDILKAAQDAANAAVDGNINTGSLKVTGPGVNDVINAAGETVNDALNGNVNGIGGDLQDAINNINAGNIVNDALNGQTINLQDALNVARIDGINNINVPNVNINDISSIASNANIGNIVNQLPSKMNIDPQQLANAVAGSISSGQINSAVNNANDIAAKVAEIVDNTNIDNIVNEVKQAI